MSAPGEVLNARSIRKRLGFSVAEFAVALGTHVSTIYRWEKSGAKASIDPYYRRLLQDVARRHRRCPPWCCSVTTLLGRVRAAAHRADMAALRRKG